jgi:hypothetical protein
MTHRTPILLISLLLATSGLARADVYSWTDEQGTIHLTEDGEAVPPKYRSGARRLVDNGAAEAAASEAKAPAEEEKAAPAKVVDTGGDERYDFTTREQWEAEMRNQEDAMTRLRQEMDDLAAQVAKIPTRTVARDNLVMEHHKLRGKFAAMKDRYHRLVEAARTAGFQVDLQQ